MKLQYLICLSIFAFSAMGSELAGSYQTVFCWYAYQLELQANSDNIWSGTRKIAPHCSTKGNNMLPCNFDEFAKHIKKKGGVPKIWKGSSGVKPDEKWPDATTAADGLTKAGYQNHADYKKLYPTLEILEGHNTRFDEVYKPIVASIQKSRVNLGAKGVDLTDEMKKLVVATTAFTEFRIQEHSAYIIEAFGRYHSARGLSFEVLTREDTNTHTTETYQKLDTERMLSDNPSLTSEIKDQIYDFVDNYDKNDPKGSSHAAALQHCENFLKQLGQDPC